MAKFVLTDASIVINAVDLSDHVESLTINYEAEAQDCTSMGDTTRAFLGGLKNWSMDVTFRQDYAASEVDVTLFGIVGSQITVTAKPTSAAVSTTNPSYSGTALLTTYTPIGNAVGDLAAAPVSFVSAGALTRATS